MCNDDKDNNNDDDDAGTHGDHRSDDNHDDKDGHDVNGDDEHDNCAVQTMTTLLLNMMMATSEWFFMCKGWRSTVDGWWMMDEGG